MEEKKSLMSFWDWYEGLNAFEKAEARVNIIKTCMWKVEENGRCHKWEFILAGNVSRLDTIYKKIINKIAGQQLTYSVDVDQITASNNV